MSRRHNKVTFKTYNMDQLCLPIQLETLIPENHLVRIVNSTIDSIDATPLIKKYKGGGTSSFNPIMMLKVIVFAYSQRIYSSRRIAKALRENISFMWLSGMNKPDHRTINNFRSSIMRDVIDDVFTSVIEFLIKERYVSLENYFLDGTKIEANANKYSYVWAKNTKRYKNNTKEKIKDLLKHIDDVNEAENKLYGDKDLEEFGDESEIDSEKLENIAKQINEKLSKKPNDRNLLKVKKVLEKDYIPKIKKYEEQEAILNGRNSYSKTDKDATFLKMKDGGNKDAPVRPGYNIQAGTENQFVLGYSIHQRAGDTGCFIPHLKKFERLLGELPENIVTDAGYGSEENYEFLEEKNLGNYVKHNMFYQEQTGRIKKNKFRQENFEYDENKDEFICPAGKKMIFKYIKKEKTDNGYETERRVYECVNCNGCELKEKCTKAIGNRTMQISFRFKELKKRANANLCSEKGIKLRKKRGVDVESVFGRIKNNWGFKRLLLRGLEKVNIELGIVFMAHNLAKVALA